MDQPLGRGLDPVRRQALSPVKASSVLAKAGISIDRIKQATCLVPWPQTQVVLLFTLTW